MPEEYVCVCVRGLLSLFLLLHNNRERELAAYKSAAAPRSLASLLFSLRAATEENRSSLGSRIILLPPNFKDLQMRGDRPLFLSPRP